MYQQAYPNVAQQQDAIYYPNLQYYGNSLNSDPSEQRPLVHHQNQVPPQVQVEQVKPESQSEPESPVPPCQHQCKRSRRFGCCVGFCLFLTAAILLFLGFSGLPMVLVGHIARADQSQCAIVSKNPQTMPFNKMSYVSPINVRSVTLSLPKTPFYAQHVIRIRGHARNAAPEFFTTIRATKAEFTRDFTIAPQIRQNQWVIDVKARKQMFPKGCATMEIELFVPIQMEAITLNLPESASLSIDDVKINNLIINQKDVTNKRACGGWMRRWGGPKRAHHAFSRHAQHEKSKHAKRPHGNMNFLFEKKKVNMTRVIMESVKIISSQRVVLFESKSKMISIDAHYVNLTSVADADQIVIKAQEIVMDKIKANKLDFSGEHVAVTLGSLDIAHVTGKVKNGKVNIKIQPNTLLDLKKTKRGEMTFGVQDIEWIRNQDNEKLGKWKCTTECKYDLRINSGKSKLTVSA